MPSNQDKEESIWSAPFVMLMITNLFFMLGTFMTNTTLPVFLTDLNVDVAMVGVITGSFAATAIGVRPFAGPAFDSFPRKKLLMLMQCIGIISMLGYAFQTDPTIILCFRLFHGIGIGCSGPIAFSLVGEFIPRSKFATGISVYAISTSAAQVIGPAFGLFVAEMFGYRILYISCASLIAIALICVCLVKEPPRELLPYKVNLHRTFAKEVLEHTLVIALFTIAYGSINSYLVLMAREFGINNVGFFFAIYALALIVAAPQYGKLSDRYGNERTLLLGSFFFVVSFVLLHFAHTIPLLCITAVAAGLGYGASGPQIQSLAMRTTEKERSAVVNNTYFTGIDIGMLLGPSIAGFATQTIIPHTETLGQAYSNMWLVMLVPILLGVLIIIRWNIILNRKKKQQ